MRELLARLKAARHVEWIVLVAVVAVAVLLMAGRAQEASTNATDMEARMERVLSSVRGAGRVKVLLNETEATVSAFSSGETTPGVIEGVVIVAEGAGNVRVALELTRAAQAFLGIDADRIEVFEMGG